MNSRMKVQISFALIALLVLIVQNISRAKVIFMVSKQGNEKLKSYHVHGTIVAMLIYVKQ